MKNWRDWSIARKLGWLLAFNTAVVVLVVAMVFTVGTAFSRFVEAREQVEALAGMVGENVRAALAFDDPQSALRTLQALRAKEEVADAVLTNAKGEVFAQVSFQLADEKDTLETVIEWFSNETVKVSHQIVDGSVTLGRVDLSIRLSAIWVGAGSRLAADDADRRVPGCPGGLAGDPVAPIPERAHSGSGPGVQRGLPRAGFLDSRGQGGR